MPREQSATSVAALDACRFLSGSGESIEALEHTVPGSPGLYAIHGGDAAWQALGFERPEGLEVPLYVGKAERSLRSRDIRSHFMTGKTGSSTVRRSVAALLAGPLAITAQPRNTAKPDHFANFGLDPEGDERLTQWMRSNLTLAYWLKTPGVSLDLIESEVIAQWQPVLNIDKVLVPDERLKAARAVLAARARQWANVCGA